MIYIILLITYVYSKIYYIVFVGISSMTTSDYAADPQILRDNRISNYSDTFDLVFGTSSETLDFMDNPYISVSVYERT